MRSIEFNDKDNTFQLLLDKGDAATLSPSQTEEYSKKLFEYFQIGLTLPNSMFWVNLRPDSADNIIDPYLEKTDVGKVLLEADLQLKKDLARFTDPATLEGRQYWDKLYAKAEQIFGPEDIEIPTITRPWIVPGEIIIKETANGAFIYKAALKVMLEQDYLKDSPIYDLKDPRLKELNEYSSGLIREKIVPGLNRDVNSSKRYAGLRQVYYSLILAQWYKSGNRNDIGKGIGRGMDQKDLNGLTSPKQWSKDAYYKAYRRSFQEGEYSRRETVNSPAGLTVRQYFSGGLILDSGKLDGGRSAIVIQSKDLYPIGNLENAGAFLKVAIYDDGTAGQQDGGKEDENRISYAVEEIKKYDRGKSREILETFFSFEDFMNEALFNPDWGYYGSGKVRIINDKFDEGHFVTYPESMSPYFGRLVGMQVFNIWKQMKAAGRIDPDDKFQVLEFGAGNGTLAYDMLSFLTRQPMIYPQDEDWKEFVSRLHYVIGEKSESLREKKQRPLLAVFGKMVEIREADAREPGDFAGSAFKGVIVSNELPDAFGVQRVRFDRRFIENGFFEICVAVPTLSRDALLHLGLPEGKVKDIDKAGRQYSRSLKLPAHSDTVYLSAKDYIDLVTFLERSQNKGLRGQFERGLRFKEIFVDGKLVPELKDYIDKNRGMIAGRIKKETGPVIIPVNSAAAEYIRSAAKILNAKGSQGYLMTIDYGGNSHEIIRESIGDMSVRTYSDNNRRGKDYYVYAGHKDITADVDATYLHRAGEDAGLTTVVFGHQGMLWDPEDTVSYALIKENQPLRYKKFLANPGFFLLLQASRNIPERERYKYPYYVAEWGRPRGAALDPEEMLFIRPGRPMNGNAALLNLLGKAGVNDPFYFVEQVMSVWARKDQELTRALFSHYWDKPLLAKKIIDVLKECDLIREGPEDIPGKADGGRLTVNVEDEISHEKRFYDWFYESMRTLDDEKLRIGVYPPEVYENVIQRSPPEKDDIVLDIGCGTGTSAVALSKKARYVIAVDFSAQALEIAGRLLRVEGIDTRIFDKNTSGEIARGEIERGTVLLLEASADNLGVIPDKFADKIYAINMFPLHPEGPAAAELLSRYMAEFSRKLKDNGVISFSQSGRQSIGQFEKTTKLQVLQGFSDAGLSARTEYLNIDRESVEEHITRSAGQLGWDDFKKKIMEEIMPSMQWIFTATKDQQGGGFKELVVNLHRQVGQPIKGGDDYRVEPVYVNLLAEEYGVYRMKQFNPVSYLNISESMTRLENQLNHLDEGALKNLTLWEKAAWIMKEYYKIHPFIDGNKRTAMRLIGKYLADRGFPMEREIEYLKTVSDQLTHEAAFTPEMTEYYAALGQAVFSNDISKLAALFDAGSKREIPQYIILKIPGPYSSANDIIAIKIDIAELRPEVEKFGIDRVTGMLESIAATTLFYSYRDYVDKLIKALRGRSKLLEMADVAKNLDGGEERIAPSEELLRQKYAASDFDAREFVADLMEVYSRGNLHPDRDITTSASYRFDGSLLVRDFPGNDEYSNIRVRQLNMGLRLLANGVTDPAVRERFEKALRLFIDLPELDSWTNFEVLETVLALTRIAGIDPDKKAKAAARNSARLIEKEIEEFIGSAPDKLEAALRVSLLGNSLDLADPDSMREIENDSANEFLKRQLDKLAQKRFWVNDTDAADAISQIRSLIDAGDKTFLILLDNAGEDYINLISIVPQLLANGCKVVIGGKSLPALNDATAEEIKALLSDPAIARILGPSISRVSVIGTGTVGLGIDTQRVSGPLHEAWTGSDAVILFGQANFYTAKKLPLTKPAVYLLKVKWDREGHGYNGGDYVLEYNDASVKQSDGGTTGGIDLRALPLAGQPSAAPVIMPQLQQLAAQSKMTDLNKEWSDIQKQMQTRDMPYGRIKEYIAVCLTRQDCRRNLDQATVCLLNILKIEEEQALSTKQELKEILMCLG